jgi:single-stranded DNA-binding protein
MQSINMITLIGHLICAPKVIKKTYRNEVHLVVATSRRWRDQSTGLYQEFAQQHHIAVRDTHLIGYAQQLPEGALVFVTGTLEYSMPSNAKPGTARQAEIVVSGSHALLSMISAEASDGKNNLPAPAPGFQAHELPY